MPNQLQQLAVKMKKEVAEGASDAQATLHEGLSADATGFTEALRQAGVFRCSSYAYKTRVLRRLVKSALEYSQGDTTLSHSSKEYFQSVDVLLSLGATCRAIYRDHIRNLNTKSLKSYIAATDLLFWYPPCEYHESSLRIGLKGFGVEELAGALSTHIHELGCERDLTKADVNTLYEAKVAGDFYTDRLGAIAALNRFREAEVLVDAFGYRVSRSGKVTTIAAADPRFEQSMRLGYIQFVNQMISDSNNLGPQVKSVSLEEAARHILKKAGDRVCAIRTEPAERIVLGLSDVPEVRDLIAGNTFFREEITEMSLIQKEFLLEPEHITETCISPELNILDIVKLQRLFRLMFWIFKQFVADHNLQDKPIFYRSMVPVFAETKLEALLIAFFGKEKAKAYLEALSWKPSSNRIFDIQAQPFMLCGNFYMLPIGIVSMSNIVRNLLVVRRFRFDAESSTDPVGDELETAFRAAGASVRRNVSYSFSGDAGEIDFLALMGTHLFAFECKNSLHPCNIFELRTSYDYIRKGAQQVKSFSSAVDDETFRNALARKTGLPITDSTSLHIAVVTGNRMFTGWREDGVPVRHLHEMTNVVSTGRMKMKASCESDATVKVIEIKLWHGDTFAPTDLVAYIEHGRLHAPRFSAMTSWKREYHLRNKMLVFESYLMDPDQVVKNMATEFPLRISEEPNPSFAIPSVWG